MGGNNDFFENFERNKHLKKLPSMQRVNRKEFGRLIGWFLQPGFDIIIETIVSIVALKPYCFNINIKTWLAGIIRFTVC